MTNHPEKKYKKKEPLFFPSKHNTEVLDLQYYIHAKLISFYQNSSVSNSFACFKLNSIKLYSG